MTGSEQTSPTDGNTTSATTVAPAPPPPEATPPPEPPAPSSPAAEAALPGPIAGPNPPQQIPGHKRAQGKFRLNLDRLYSGFALLAAGLALLFTGRMTAPAANAGLRMLNLADTSEADTHGQLMRIERTLHRLSRCDSMASHERTPPKYDARFRHGRDMVMNSIKVDSAGLLDSAHKLGTIAVQVYEESLKTLDSSTDAWAYGAQLRDWAVFNVYRIARRGALATSFRIQIQVAQYASVFGWVILLLGILAVVTSVGTGRVPRDSLHAQITASALPSVPVPIPELSGDQMRFIELLQAEWKTVIETQMHFNDLIIRLRSIAITALTTLVGAALAIIKIKQVTGGAAVILYCAPWLLWLVVFVLDFFYYHRLLMGSVDAGHKFDDNTEFRKLGLFGMTNAISNSVTPPSSKWMIGIYYLVPSGIAAVVLVLWQVGWLKF